MAPVIPCSIGNISLFPRTTTFTSRKVNQLTKCKISGKSTQSFPLSQSISIIFPKYKSGSIIHHQQRSRILVTIGTDVAVEEPNSVIEGEDTDKTSEVPPDSAETSEASLTGNESVTPTAQSKRPRPVRKSDMPPVKNDELIPGAAFTGKVRSVLPFGAFVDFGAFTDGLVHVSQMSDSFVKDVGSFVSIGQEVKVKLLEANFETGRISLTMREGDDINKLQQRKDAPSVGSSDKPRPARKNTGMSNQKRDEVQKSTKFFRGQVLDGTVKNLTRAGAFISLPEGEEGFLPTSEESEGYGNVMGSSSLLVGQEVNVRVLRITRGQVTLTMKRKEDMEDLNLKLNKGVVHVATNPFELAFRKNEAIAAFLEERESKQKSAEINGSLKSSKQIEGHVDPTETESNTPVVDLPSSIDNVQVNVYSELDKVTEDDDPEKTVSDSLQNAGSAIEIIQKDEVSPKTSTLANTGINVDPVTHVVKEESNETDTTNEAANEMSSSETVVSEEVVASVDDTLLSDNKVVTPLVENEMSSVAANVALNDASIIDEVKEDINITDSPGETVDQISSSESKVAEEVVVSDANDTLIEDKVEIQAPPVVENEMPSAVSKEDEKEATSIPEQNGSVTSDDQTNIPFSQGSTIKDV